MEVRKINSNKIRLDSLLVERGLVKSRQHAQALIMGGKVSAGGRVITKAGAATDPGSEINISEDLPYVGRGGKKLEGALDGFNIDVGGLTVMDVGASTGGFTDCLLKMGAAKVHAVDVGRGLMDFRLRSDGRVHLIEGRNIRYLGAEEVGEKVDMACIDVSFISLKKVIPRVKEFLKPSGRVLALIKPQFEVGRFEVGKGGVVRDGEKHRRVIEDIESFSVKEGLTPLGVVESQVKGRKGNKEFWLYLSCGA
ncbi:MAG: TlyA family RNA methyltransferase [Deltaproteobacteria bacterium]|nr:TlyA family RNA methyltransferase [Deltaproteobacteria bacterium]